MDNIEISCTEKVGENYLFKPTDATSRVPIHLRNPGILNAFYNQLTQGYSMPLYINSSKSKFLKLIKKGQIITMDTTIEHSSGNQVSIYQSMYDEKKHLLATHKARAIKTTTPAIHNSINSMIFDSGRLGELENARLRSQDLYESGMPVFMVVRSTDYTFSGEINPNKPLKLISGFGNLEPMNGSHIPLLGMYQVLFSGRVPIANCCSYHVFVDENGINNEFGDEIRERIQNPIMIDGVKKPGTTTIISTEKIKELIEETTEQAHKVTPDTLDQIARTA